MSPVGLGGRHAIHFKHRNGSFFFAGAMLPAQSYKPMQVPLQTSALDVRWFFAKKSGYFFFLFFIYIYIFIFQEIPIVYSL